MYTACAHACAHVSRWHIWKNYCGMAGRGTLSMPSLAASCNSLFQSLPPTTIHIYIYTYIHIYIYTYIFIYIYAYAHTYIHTYLHVYIYMYVCMYVLLISVSSPNHHRLYFLSFSHQLLCLRLLTTPHHTNIFCLPAAIPCAALRCCVWAHAHTHTLRLHTHMHAYSHPRNISY